MEEKGSAIHPKGSFDEIQAVSLVCLLLVKTYRAMPDLKALDRWPNIDGYIELVDDTGQPDERLLVQVKKIPACKSGIPTYSFDDNKFLNYCEHHSVLSPVVFIGVDIENEKAYWLHMSSKLISDLKGKKTVSFNPDNTIDYKDQNFIVEWNRIIAEYRENIIDCKRLVEGFKRLQQIEGSDIILTFDNLDQIDRFRICYWDLASNAFSIVKDVYYPTNTCDIGFAYSVYESCKLSFTMYPITKDYGKPPCKKISNLQHSDMEDLGFGFGAWFEENPIEERPEEFAKETISNQVFRILKERRLKHSGSKFLATEILFCILDKKHKTFRLKQSDTYSVENLSKAYSNLINESQKRLSELDPRYGYSTQFETGPLATIPRPLQFYKEAIDTLQELGVDNISRIYKLPDPNRPVGPGGFRSFYRVEDVKVDLDHFFMALEGTYNGFIKNNFPRLTEELSLKQMASKIVVSYSFDDFDAPYPRGPVYYMFYLKGPEEKNGNLIEIADSSTQDYFKRWYNKIKCVGDALEFKGNSYTILMVTGSGIGFIFEPTPMLNYIYKILAERLKDYFHLPFAPFV